MNGRARSWMAFVDGENLTLRGQEVAKRDKRNLHDSTEYERDVFLWFRIGTPPRHPDWTRLTTWLQPDAIRAHYYTSAVGDDDALAKIRERLREIGFDPHVFKRDPKRNRSKGVDIALTKDMLSHAFLNNYDAAVLVAGDGDYMPLVEEVKRLGKIVYVAFFTGDGAGLNPDL